MFEIYDVGKIILVFFLDLRHTYLVYISTYEYFAAYYDSYLLKF